MAKGVKTRNIESFREGLMEYAYGRCSQAEAAKIAGMSVPTFRKYANMHFLGIPFPDTLFKASRATVHVDTQILVYTVQAKPKNRRQVYEVFEAD